MSIEAFIIQGNKLKPVDDLFVSKSQQTGRIDFDYDNASVQYTNRELDLIHFDPKAKKLYVAIVAEDGKVSNKNIVYVVKGNKFVFTGIEKAK
ncbi:hypothetical protein GCM10011514_36460 [Emticicia aquatilis]|uniref:Uncharacterized protein n=1 Tax=Emticicia aquatilis TaxID=1537369 RepID=A0A916Z0S7_9BACT|nr:hypothetical protein [Emticicia aquatilis]GGD69033.1 hypothetical protein GCM10011514_36460 [Emticicia aquatilis]